MSTTAGDRAGSLAEALLRGNSDDGVLRQLPTLCAQDVNPSLEKTMLMALSDTADGRVRNVLAIALAKIQSHQAIPILVSLLSDPRTLGYRSTILYALQKLSGRLSISDLVLLILFDTPEVQEEAAIMLEDAVPRSSREDRLAAVQLVLDSLNSRSDARTTEIVFDTLQILIESFKA